MPTHEEKVRRAVDRHTERLIKDGAPTKEGWKQLTERDARDRAVKIAEKVEREKKGG
jgi:hypothetical protein